MKTIDQKIVRARRLYCFFEVLSNISLIALIVFCGLAFAFISHFLIWFVIAMIFGMVMMISRTFATKYMWEETSLQYEQFEKAWKTFFC